CAAWGSPVRAGAGTPGRRPRLEALCQSLEVPDPEEDVAGREPGFGRVLHEEVARLLVVDQHLAGRRHLPGHLLELGQGHPVLARATVQAVVGGELATLVELAVNVAHHPALRCPEKCHVSSPVWMPRSTYTPIIVRWASMSIPGRKIFRNSSGGK